MVNGKLTQYLKTNKKQKNMWIKKFIRSLRPVNVAKNEILIAQYWEKDRLRKIEESKYTKYSSNENFDHATNIKNKLESLGAVDIEMFSELLSAPWLEFKINDILYKTPPLYDFGYDNVMNEINKILKIK